MAYSEADAAAQRRYNATPKAKARTARWTAKFRATQREFLAQYKEDKGCVDCGERDPVVLTFAHRIPRSKNGGRAVASMTGTGWPTLLKEIAKCDVVCWNCHIRRDDKWRRKYKRGRPSPTTSIKRSR